MAVIGVLNTHSGVRVAFLREANAHQVTGTPVGSIAAALTLVRTHNFTGQARPHHFVPPMLAAHAV